MLEPPDLESGDEADGEANEKPFPLTTEWFELQRQEMVERARENKEEREANRRSRAMKKGRTAITGTISSVAFASGDQFVVGCWPQSPIGPFSDIMWLDAEDRRTLITASETAAEFITDIYSFDKVQVESLETECDGAAMEARTADLHIRLSGGRSTKIPFTRPLAFTRYIEAPVARRLMGVEVYGLSPTGVREWYQATGWRWVRSAVAFREEQELGELAEFNRPMNVGFSNPPKRSALVSLQVTIDR